MRACSSGRLDGVSSSRIASRGRRSASAARTWPARSGPSGGGSRAVRRGVIGPGRASDGVRERRADRVGRAQHGELDGAAVRLLGILRDEHQTRRRLHQRAWVVRVLADRAGADDQHRVVGLERLAQAGAARGQVAGEQRVVLREAGLSAERLLEDRAVQALGEGDQCVPALRAGARDDRGALRLVEHGRERLDRLRIGRLRAQQLHRPEDLVRLWCRIEPVVHRDDHDRRAAGGDRLVVGADDRSGHVLRAGGLVAPDRVLAGEPVELAGQERLQREVAAVLLADDDHQRRAVGPARSRSRRRRCRTPACCAAARAPASRGRARGRRPSPRPCPRGARARSGGHRADLRAAGPRSTPDWRRSSSAPDGAGRRTSRHVRSQSRTVGLACRD